MDLRVKKVFELMKKSYDQPIIFHLLHSHLVFLLKKVNPDYEMTDDWSKVIILSAHPNTTPNQGIEIKIQKFINVNKKNLKSKNINLILMSILYYLLNRPGHLINHIILFELINGYLGRISDYYDGFILNITIKFILAKIYDNQIRMKVKPEYIVKMVTLIKQSNISDNNKVKSLVCFVFSNISPFDLNFVQINNSYLGYKYLEAICLYAKYTKDTSFIKDILPSDPFFIQELSAFMQGEFSFKYEIYFDAKKCVLKDISIFKYLRDGYSNASNKEEYVRELVDYLYSLTTK